MLPRSLLLGLVAAVAVAVSAPATVLADHSLPGSTTEPVHPGVQTVTGNAQCTANFVFTDGDDLYLGQAAHCGAPSSPLATDGCDATPPPQNAPVRIDGATKPGVLVYNSWRTMQEVGEDDAATCAYNDFALVRIDPDDHDRVDPRIPFFGGPTEVAAADTRRGDEMYSYGNSGLRGGLAPLSPKIGYSLGSHSGRWTHTVYFATPGVPGDSGSAVIDDQGRAVGTLSTVALAPLAGSNGVTDLGRALAYATTTLEVDLVTADFRGVLGG